MKRVLLLGVTGMLGHAVYNVLKDKYDVVGTARDICKALALSKDFNQLIEFDAELMMADYTAKKGSAYLSDFIRKVGEVDYVINCIGVTIPFSLKNPGLTFFVNSAFTFSLGSSGLASSTSRQTACTRARTAMRLTTNSLRSPRWTSMACPKIWVNPRTVSRSVHPSSALS